MCDDLSDVPDTAVGIALLARYEGQRLDEFLSVAGETFGLTPRAAFCSLEDAGGLVFPPGYSIFDDDGVVGSEDWMRLKTMSASSVRTSPIVVTLLGRI